MGRCQDCGSRVAEGELFCENCRPALTDEDDWVEDPEQDYDEAFDDLDDGVDDPELLAQAEARVKALPLYDLSGLTGTYTLSGIDQDERRPSQKPPRDEPTPPPGPASGECPACGRQAQKGWEICPWCGTDLPRR